MADITGMLQAAAGAGGVTPSGYQISRSLRFNSADSAYLSRTPASAGNRKTWTWSGWVKRSGQWGSLLTSISGTNFTQLTGVGDQLVFVYYPGSATAGLDSVAVFRDYSAWYHIVLAVDTTQATSTDRVKLYVNNVLQSMTQRAGYTLGYPSQNTDTFINATQLHELSRSGAGAGFSGYMAEVYLIDGQALTPSDFGETDATTGVWNPKAYAGTYGTNGFYLDFSDNSSTTTLGYDAAGSNDWTPNNFSVTAGAGNDSLVDSPTQYGTDTGAGGEVRGNYATLNPLSKASTATLANGNLNWSTTSSYALAWSTMSLPTSGKWYWEVTPTATPISTSVFQYTGVVEDGTKSTNYIEEFGVSTAYAPNGNIYYSGGSAAYGNTWTTNDVIGVAVDMDNGAIYYSKNGVWQNSGDPESGASKTGAARTNLLGKVLFPAIATNATLTTSAVFNFGQRPFAYTAPSGFKALCTQNLPTPTVVQGDDYFNTVLYTGTGSAQSITGVGFQPDWVWIKERSGAADHGLYDAVRGVQNQLESNTTTAETTESTGLTAFGSDGFTVGALAQLNTNTDTYVAWNWNAGGSNATNTDGTITSTVRANPTAGFSIVSYTGTGSAATVGHGLSAAPAMIIVKNRDQADAWQVYHQANTSAPETDYLVLNTTAATADAADRWNDTAPTSSVFSIGNGVEVNTNTEDYIAYVFAEVEGYSKFGSYTGNGSADGPFVYTGFRPAFILFKITSTTSAWALWDTKRAPYNAFSYYAPVADQAIAEASSSVYALDLLSNGFKPRGNNDQTNASGATIIFAAFAENPFKFSLAR